MNLMKPNLFGILLLTGVMAFYSCSPKKSSENQEEEMAEEVNTGLSITSKTATVEGKEALIFTLKNANGVEVDLSNYGGVITRLVVPDREGNLENVVLHYADLEGYSTSTNYFGATIGRYANRIAEGNFELEGETYELATNDGDHHLHGGEKGFDKVFWEAETIENEKSVGVKLTYVSTDGEEGYPGELTTDVVFQLNNEDELSISFEAVTDKPTVVNLTHHGYFNLSGLEEDILGHELTILAELYTPVDNTLIPTGEVKPVAGTPFDFTSAHTIGDRIDQVEGGYDHNYVVKTEADGDLAKMAELYHPATGRVMELYADSPAVQFYSGNFLDGSIRVDGVTYKKHFGLCLEPQTFPNSPNEPSFPSARLNPGETYTHNIEYHFGVK